MNTLMRVFLLLLAVWTLLIGGLSEQAAAQQHGEPVVARVEMKLAVGDELLDTIEKGDLLTVLEEREDAYVIVTFNGHRGAVAKVNAVKLAESVDIYSELIKQRPEEGRLYTLRAGAWWALEKNEQALADFDKAIELGYEAAHAYSSRGLYHAAAGNFAEAIADYTVAIEKDAEDIGPRINRAAAFLATRRFADAIADYTAAIEQDPENPAFYQQRAVALKAAGQLQQAVADFDQAIELNPDDVASRMGRGFLHFQQQDHQAAVADFSSVIQLNPEAAVAYNNRGFNYQMLDKPAAALKDYNKAIELAPRYGLAHQNRAWLLATAADDSLRDPASAIESAKAACELSEYKDISDLSALAAALAAHQEFDKAIGWQEKVIEMADEQYQPFAKRMLDRYQAQQAYDADAVEKELAAAREIQQREQP